METSKDLPKFAVLQLSGCSGCEVSLLNSDEWISNFQLVYMPLVVTSNKIPDDVEVLLVTGGVRTDEEVGAPTVAGQAESAPHRFELWPHLLTAAWVSALVFALYYANYVYGWITAEDLDFYH